MDIMDIMEITMNALNTNDVHRDHNDHRAARASISNPIVDEDAANEWASYAFSFMQEEDDREKRQLLIDNLIEHAQMTHAEIEAGRVNAVTPYRKAYSFFFSERRPLIERVHKKRGSKEKFEIAKKVSKWWKMIHPSERVKYYMKEEEDRLRYHNEHSYYLLQQQHLVGLIDWLETQRSFIITWPTDMLTTWVDMLKKKM
jgi:hypothetical protein